MDAPDGVRQARFFQLDRLLLLAVGNSLRSYTYEVEEKPKDDISEYVNPIRIR